MGSLANGRNLRPNGRSFRKYPAFRKLSAFGMFINIPDRILLKIMDPPLLIIRFVIYVPMICQYVTICYNVIPTCAMIFQH